MLELTNIKRVNMIFFFIEIQLRHKTLAYVNTFKFLRSKSFVHHCCHIETQTNHVVTGASILIRAPTEELDNSENIGKTIKAKQSALSSSSR